MLDTSKHLTATINKNNLCSYSFKSNIGHDGVKIVVIGELEVLTWTKFCFKLLLVLLIFPKVNWPAGPIKVNNRG